MCVWGGGVATPEELGAPRGGESSQQRCVDGGMQVKGTAAAERAELDLRLEAADEGLVQPVVTAVIESLTGFQGIARRMEPIARLPRCHIYDDYAHHPTEVRTAGGRTFLYAWRPPRVRGKVAGLAGVSTRAAGYPTRGVRHTAALLTSGVSRVIRDREIKSHLGPNCEPRSL